MYSRAKLTAAGMPAALALALTGIPTASAATVRCDPQTHRKTVNVGGQTIDLTAFSCEGPTTETVEHLDVTSTGTSAYTVRTALYRFDQYGVAVQTTRLGSSKGTTHGRTIMRKIPSQRGPDGFILAVVITTKGTTEVVLYV